MGRLSRFFGGFTRTDEERLDEEVREWADSIPDTDRISQCPTREPVQISGVVRRLTLRPSDGSITLEAVVTDGTGEITAMWTGRDHIPGLALGTQVVLKGVLGKDRSRRRMVNPDFEFA
jgi:RecG-like helicase